MNPTLAEYGLDGLSTEQRLTLIDLLWDSLDIVDDTLSDAQIQELDRRCAAADADPGAGIPWEEFKGRWLAGT